MGNSCEESVWPHDSTATQLERATGADLQELLWVGRPGYCFVQVTPPSLVR